MATDLGKVGIVAKGAYNSASTYEMLDMVYYNNNSYIAKQNVPANTLPTNTTYWQPAIVPVVTETSLALSALFPNDLTGTINIRKENDIITYNIVNLQVISSTRVFQNTIPAGFKPSAATATMRTALLNIDDNTVTLCEINNSGTLSFGAIVQNKSYYGSFTIVA